MKYTSDGITMQIRALAKQAGLSIDEVRRRLHIAGITTDHAGGPLYGTSKVNIVAATAALAASAPATPVEPIASAQPADPVATAAAAALKLVPEPAPAGTSSGNLEDDPVLVEGIIEAGPLSEEGFPKITSPDPDYVYRWINQNPTRQMAMIQRGWRFITDPAMLRRIRPDGLLLKMRRPTGRVTHIDTELACLPKRISEAIKARRAEASGDRTATVEESLRENIEAAQTTLREKLGPGGDRHIGHIELDGDEIDARKAYASAKKRGEAPGKSRVFVGRAGGAK